MNMDPSGMLPGGGATFAVASSCALMLAVLVVRFVPSYVFILGEPRISELDPMAGQVQAIRGAISNALSAPFGKTEGLVFVFGTAFVAVCFGMFAATIHAQLVVFFGLSQIVLGVICLEYMLIPDVVTLPLAAIGLSISAAGFWIPAPNAIWGLLAGVLVAQLPRWVFGIAGGREGMSLGVAKHWGAVGTWIGPQLAVLGFVAALGLLSIVAIYLMAFRGRSSTEPAPFGPFGAIVACIAIVFFVTGRA